MTVEVTEVLPAQSQTPLSREVAVLLLAHKVRPAKPPRAPKALVVTWAACGAVRRRRRSKRAVVWNDER